MSPQIRAVMILIALAPAGLAATPPAAAPATRPALPALAANQAVSVREGDTWSPATYLAREGRRYQVRYPDGTVEWVAADRLKVGNPPGAAIPAPATPGSATPGSATPGSGGPAKPATGPAAPKRADEKPRLPPFAIGQRLELKWNGLWQAVKVVNRRGEWYLVEYEGWNNWREWAEPWRLRGVGTAYDIEGMRMANPRLAKATDGPPRPTPGPAPVAVDAWGKPTDPGAVASTPGAPAAPAKRADPFGPPDHGYPVTAVKTEPPEITAVPVGPWNLPPAAPATQPAARLPAALPAAYLPMTDSRIEWSPPRVSGTRAMVAAKGSGHDAATGLVRVDMLTGAAARFELPSASFALDLSPSGNLLVARSNGFFSSGKGRLDVYRLGPKVEHVISFLPAGKEEIADAFWVDEQTVVVVGAQRLSSWNVLAATGKWSLPITSGAAARSPDGKQVAVNTSGGVAIVSLADGKIQGLLEGAAQGDVAWSGDGLRLFSYAQSTLRGWDLRSGKENHDVTFAGKAPAGRLVAINKDFLLVGPALYSVAKQAFIWRYEGATMAAAASRVFGIGSDGKRQYLTSAVLPHPAAIQAGEWAAVAPAVLTTGMSVTLDIQPGGDEAKREQIVAGLTKTLTRAGLKVADGQPLRLVARTEAGKSETRQYEKRQFGGFPGRGEAETVTITPQITKLSLMRGDEVLWQTSRSTSNDPGFMVSLKEGESIQSRADARGPVIDWLATAEVPANVIEAKDPATLANSAWAVAGVVDKK